jgi:prevent-host-death family protein
MTRAITTTEANRNFSEILRHVQDGEEFLITSHGRPIARITKVDADRDEADREAAWQRLMEHLDSVEAVNAGSWTRDELYDD